MPPADDALHAAYTLLARRDLGVRLEAVRLARAAIPSAEGATLLALHEAVVEGLDSVLVDLGEHGRHSAALSRTDPAAIDVQRLAGECLAAWTEVRRLRDAGLSSAERVGPYVGHWMDPVGSPAWLGRMRLGVPRRADPRWVARVSLRLSGVEDDEAAEEA